MMRHKTTFHLSEKKDNFSEQIKYAAFLFNCLTSFEIL